ncbi:MAG: hypothetical protein AABX97_10085 [Candidatus Thermoplasmatota archaeon]
MIRPALALVVLSTAFALAMAATPAAAQSSLEISIVHTPPAIVLPGLQINLTAVLGNATAASVAWNNGSMASDARVPMTNLSRTQDGGWVYEAWLPAQPDGTQVTYAINASNHAGSRSESYFLTVSAPSASGITEVQQEAWMLTMAASISMAASTVAVLYWYTGRRLRRGMT